jgi:uncharacterized coiled-coil protein SlyX
LIETSVYASIPIFQEEIMTAEERITELEIRITYLVSLVDELNAVVIAQGGSIERLRAEVELLKNGMPPEVSPVERPPHY